MDLIGVCPACSGSSVKVGGPLCGAEGERNVGGESERDFAPSLTVGFPPLRGLVSRVFFASRSVCSGSANLTVSDGPARRYRSGYCNGAVSQAGGVTVP